MPPSIMEDRIEEIWPPDRTNRANDERVLRRVNIPDAEVRTYFSFMLWRSDERAMFRLKARLSSLCLGMHFWPSDTPTVRAYR